jgi:hypothetical protein
LGRLWALHQTLRYDTYWLLRALALLDLQLLQLAGQIDSKQLDPWFTAEIKVKSNANAFSGCTRRQAMQDEMPNS